jgi:hypothetical protein
VAEVVGWTVIDGQAFRPNTGVLDASGDTIVNLKLGVRGTFGPESIYIGWGTTLTDKWWYEDIARVEYRRLF